ncbi:hypothetical protein E1293_29905 [Actinomadura darangshiensis]|uniref:Uncharacterized protein n=1 Tax=Actinomadura darangshiensis TaxID=705336 RepID=A0A4R5AQ01_9ACTN|nr:hypothetical protein [Actinomadura darangshiensis]TDD74235.1 hypothetical protein E1293_29905 [Actinomadura darangshiensis]
MGVEHTGKTDTHGEGVDRTQGTDRPPGPPPDRPGEPGSPSRLESRRASREAALAEQAKQNPQQPPTQETGTEQRDERQQEKDESSSAEPTGEKTDSQTDSEDTDKTSETSEAESDIDSGTGEQETDQSQPESEKVRPDGYGEQSGTADTSEATPEAETERPREREDEKDETVAAEPTAENGDAPAEPLTTEDPQENGGTDPKTSDATEAGQPDGSGEEPRMQDAGEIQESSDERDQAEAQDPQVQDGRPLPSRTVKHSGPAAPKPARNPLPNRPDTTTHPRTRQLPAPPPTSRTAERIPCSSLEVRAAPTIQNIPTGREFRSSGHQRPKKASRTGCPQSSSSTSGRPAPSPRTVIRMPRSQQTRVRWRIPTHPAQTTRRSRGKLIPIGLTLRKPKAIRRTLSEPSETRMGNGPTG